MYEDLHDVGPAYVRNCLSPVTSTCPIRFSSLLQVPPTRYYCLMNQEQGFFCCFTSSMEHHSPQGQAGPNLDGLLEGPEDHALPSDLRTTEWCETDRMNVFSWWLKRFCFCFNVYIVQLLYFSVFLYIVSHPVSPMWNVIYGSNDQKTAHLNHKQYFIQVWGKKQGLIWIFFLKKKKLRGLLRQLLIK